MWNYLMGLGNDICLWVVRKFPTSSKEGDVLVGLILFCAYIFGLISAIGLVVQFVFGIAWWWIWVVLIGYRAVVSLYKRLRE